MASISYHAQYPFIERYGEWANRLMYGNLPNGIGSLLLLGGPLQEHRDEAPAYYVCHEKSDGIDAPIANPSRWNLDFTLPTVIVAKGQQSADQLSPKQFVLDAGALLLGKKERFNEKEADALGAGIVRLYESYWFKHQERKLDKVAGQHAGKNTEQVTDHGLQALAFDVALRKANLNKLYDVFCHKVREAHDIAHVYPGTPQEYAREQALDELAVGHCMDQKPFGGRW